MKNLIQLLALVALPFFYGSTALAVQQQGTPIPVPVDRNKCFQDYFDHLKQCRAEFCPNRLTNCNNTLLSACISGAKTAFQECLVGG